MEKTFLVFTGSDYYPEGGWKDFRESFADYDEAMRFIANFDGLDWWQIVNILPDGTVSIFDQGKRS